MVTLLTVAVGLMVAGSRGAGGTFGEGEAVAELEDDRRDVDIGSTEKVEDQQNIRWDRRGAAQVASSSTFEE